MAFYDSVSVIAGRAVVTIDLPEKHDKTPIIVQPRRRHTLVKKSKSQSSINNIPEVVLDLDSDKRYESLGHEAERDEEYLSSVKKTVSFGDISKEKLNQEYNLAHTSAISETTFLALPTNVELRKKSLSERRQSRSLHIKIDSPKEIPIIRQSSVPKFFLDTPEMNQTESSLVKTPLASLQSPMICKDGFCYDLKSVVQIEKMNFSEKDKKNVPLVHKDSSAYRLGNIRDRILLKKSKSSVSSTNLPHSNYI